MSIRKLTDATTRELKELSVINSPLAVVKELLDNAVDAGASKICVSLDQDTGGLKHIQVVDDGCGVPLDSANLVCLQHTTSKIVTVEGISCGERLRSRGEAMFAIAELVGLNGLQITSRPEDCPIGYSWTISEYGKLNEDSVKPVASMVGTSVSVRGLFDKFPARKKLLLKSIKQSNTQVYLLIQKYALCFGKIRFELKEINQELKTISSQVFIPEEAKIKILGKDILMNEVFKIQKGVEIFFYLTANQSGKSVRVLSINQRLMCLSSGRGKLFNKAIKSVLQDLFPTTSWFCELKISSNLTLDVNIELKEDSLLFKDFEAIVEKLKGKMSKKWNNQPLLGSKPCPELSSLDDKTLIQSPTPKEAIANTYEQENDTTLADVEFKEKQLSNAIFSRLSSNSDSSISSSKDISAYEEDSQISKNLKISNPLASMKMVNNNNPKRAKELETTGISFKNSFLTKSPTPKSKVLSFPDTRYTQPLSAPEFNISKRNKQKEGLRDAISTKINKIPKDKSIFKNPEENKDNKLVRSVSLKTKEFNLIETKKVHNYHKSY